MTKSLLITQGEYMVASEPDTVITTILGSCVSCCLWDPVAHVGGMNHILLATAGGGNNRSNFAGVNQMEVLINAIIKKGGVRSRLRAKVFGGGQIVAGLSNIGDLNGKFVMEFLANESIVCESHSLGGTASRHLKFWPWSGKVLQKFGSTNDIKPEPQPGPEPEGNGLELF